MVNKNFFLHSTLLLQCYVTFSMHSETHPLFLLPKDIQNKILKYVIEDNKIDVKLSQYLEKDPENVRRIIYTLYLKIKNQLGTVLKKTFQNSGDLIDLLNKKKDNKIFFAGISIFEPPSDFKIFFNPKTLELIFSIRSDRCKKDCTVCYKERYCHPYGQSVISYALGKSTQKALCLSVDHKLTDINYETNEYILTRYGQLEPSIVNKNSGKEVPSFFNFSPTELELINFKMNDHYSENDLITYFHVHQICKKPDPS